MTAGGQHHQPPEAAEEASQVCCYLSHVHVASRAAQVGLLEGKCPSASSVPPRPPEASRQPAGSCTSKGAQVSPAEPPCLPPGSGLGAGASQHSCGERWVTHCASLQQDADIGWSLPFGYLSPCLGSELLKSRNCIPFVSVLVALSMVLGRERVSPIRSLTL